MTPERAKYLLPFFTAFAEGKTILRSRNGACFGEWPEPMKWEDDRVYYEVKSEPVVRPWSKPKDVPGPVCWVRWKDKRTPTESLITAVSRVYFFTAAHSYIWASCQEMEHSTDRKTWLPCTVTDPA